MTIREFPGDNNTTMRTNKQQRLNPVTKRDVDSLQMVLYNATQQAANYMTPSSQHTLTDAHSITAHATRSLKARQHFVHFKSCWSGASDACNRLVDKPMRGD